MSVLSPTTATATQTYPDGLTDCSTAGASGAGGANIAPASTPAMNWLGRLAHEAAGVPEPVDIAAILGAVALAGVIAWSLYHHPPLHSDRIELTEPLKRIRPPKHRKPHTTPKTETTKPKRGPKGEFVKKGGAK